MNEDLQSLVDRIQKEAVQDAEAKAARILAEAEEKAAAVAAEAEREAKALLERTERESRHFTERSRLSLEQACRDLLLAVGEGIQVILMECIKEGIEDSAAPELMDALLLRLIEKADFNQHRLDLEILLNERDRDFLRRSASRRLREKLELGVEIIQDGGIDKGFKARFKDGKAHLDFTSETIAEALAQYLRPHLAEMIQRVALEKSRTKTEAETA